MDTKKEIDLIAKWMANYVHVSKSKGFVIGLSGGIDSAVVACLAVRAVGKENVIGISMPCYSSENSISDAEILARNLNIPLMSYNLEKAFEAIRKPLGKGEQPENRKISDGNIKARLRMIKLYEIANLCNYLVAGTSNRTEMMIGYFTKFGDGGCDIEPIANYYKYEIYELAKHLPEVPVSTIIKPPSADLWDGQTDETEIGITFKQLDLKLKLINDEAVPISPTFDQFYYFLSSYVFKSPIENEEEKVWRKIYNMIHNSEHKRNMPPCYTRQL